MRVLLLPKAIKSLQQELHALIDVIPEGKLVALLPSLSTLAGDVFAIETDLTAEEKKEIAECEAEYKVAPETFTPLCEVL